MLSYQFEKHKHDTQLIHITGDRILPQATSIYLTVEDAEAARRIKASPRPGEFNGNESTEEILNKIRARNEAMRTRLQKVHGADFTDQSKYDHVIATEGKSIEDIVVEILELIRRP